MLRRLSPIALIVLGSLGLVSACNGSSSPEEPKYSSYVALGDSYVSGPGIADQNLVSPDCQRSDHNYATLLDVALGRPRFADVSCGGATTETVRAGRTTEAGVAIPPQLDALKSDTALVTVGIGGNDAGVSGNLFAYCYITGTASDEACHKFTATYLPTVLPATRDRVSSILKEVHKRSPKAHVVLVGYLRVVPEKGNCKDLPISEANRAAAEALEISLNSTLRGAASDAHAQFVDVRPISLGHDACAGSKAWVNGLVNPPGDGAFLHPNAVGMRHVAAQVRKSLGKS